MLAIRLTDGKDPFFLYNLEVSEPDFHTLKKEQGLLVDFSTFPSNVISLLDLCVSQAQLEAPKFIALLAEPSAGAPGNVAVFSIVETNPFKHLQHVALKFRPGNDENVKKYLADRLTSLKEICQKQEKQIHEDQQRIRSLTLDLQNAKDELIARRTEDNRVLTEMQGAHSKELTTQKEVSLAEIQRLQKQHQQQQAETEKNFQQQLTKLQKRLDSVEQENKALMEKKFSLTAELQQLKRTADGLEAEAKQSKNELAKLRQDHTKLDTSKYEKEQDCNKLRLKLAALEQDLKSKEKLIESMTAMVDTSKDRTRNLEEALSVLKQNCAAGDTKLKECVQEINKGNKIIQQLQSDIKAAKGKLKLKVDKAYPCTASSRSMSIIPNCLSSSFAVVSCLCFCIFRARLFCSKKTSLRRKQRSSMTRNVS